MDQPPTGREAVPASALTRREIGLALACAPCLGGAAGAGAPARVDDLVRRGMSMFGAPGVAVAVVDRGEESAWGFGVRQLGRAGAVGPGTVFPLASVTKSFTAAALALLVEEGRLDWSDAVVDCLDGFAMSDPWVTRQMTVLDLLLHHSGLGWGAGDLFYMAETDAGAAEVLRALRFLPLRTGFRAGFAYTDILYVAAARLLARTAGADWTEVIRQRFLSPLAMADSAPVEAMLRTGDRVALHGRTGGPIHGVGELTVLPERGPSRYPSDPPVGAGEVMCSARDLARWLSLFLDRGMDRRSGRRLIAADSVARLLRPGTEIGPWPLIDAESAPWSLGYGLGWFVQDYRGAELCWHPGSTRGACALIAILPGHGFGLAVLANAEEGGLARAIMYHLLDQRLGAAPVDHLAIGLAERDQQQARDIAELGARAAAPPGGSRPLAGYAGRYVDPWFGGLSISLGPRGLGVDFDRSPVMKGRLEVVDKDRLRTRFDDPLVEDAVLHFAWTPAGEVRSIGLTPASPAANFSWDYADLSFSPSGAAEERSQ